MKLKKVLALMLVLAVVAMAVVGITACVDNDENDGQNPEYPNIFEDTNNDVIYTPVAMSDIKVGFIFLHDENSTYDKNFIDAANAATAKLGLSASQVMFKTNIEESDECYDAAVELAEAGCDIVFADSFGHETFLLQAAKEFPDVQFCHATGTHAYDEGLANFHNAFASIYEGRYLAGIAAGMKLKAMYGDAATGAVSDANAKIGYVGAYPYAEVKSGYTSFFLGVRSIVPNATMEVVFTNSWYDEAAEREGANRLIANGAKLISQHADSMGAPSACEQAGIPNVSYNGSTAADCPNTYIISSKINWEPYFEYIINRVSEGKAIRVDWCGTIGTGSVQLTELGAAAAPGTQEASDAAKAQLAAGTLKVFDTSKFTVKGAQLTAEQMADVHGSDYVPDSYPVVDGVYLESVYRSAPYFDIDIDGITLGGEVSAQALTNITSLQDGAFSPRLVPFDRLIRNTFGGNLGKDCCA